MDEEYFEENREKEIEKERILVVLGVVLFLIIIFI
jgi:hypothetical protein